MLLMAVAAIAAYWVKGMCGFANTLVFTSILSFGMNNVDITPMELLIAMPNNIIVAWRERKDINWRMALSVSAMVLLGGLPGALLLKNAGAQTIKLVLGGFIVFAGFHMLWQEKHAGGKPLPPLATMALNFICGIFCGLYGIGAPMAANITRMSRTTSEARSTMSIVFITDCIFRSCVYIATGIMTWEVALQAAKVLPFALLGLFLGILCIRRVNERTARYIVIFALIVSGVALILANA